MIFDWVRASLAFVLGILVFTVLLPIMSAFLPAIQETMGTTVTMMCSTAILLILVSTIYVYMGSVLGEKSENPGY